jgi:hypothetical protein
MKICYPLKSYQKNRGKMLFSLNQIYSKEN